MSDLKTLEDLRNYTIWNNQLEKSKFEEEIILKEELKAEAVKWVKRFRKEQELNYGGLRGNWEEKWIIKFFNLTEEDLE